MATLRSKINERECSFDLCCLFNATDEVFSLIDFNCDAKVDIGGLLLTDVMECVWNKIILNFFFFWDEMCKSGFLCDEQPSTNVLNQKHPLLRSTKFYTTD